jgi:hypothetical protein
MLNQHDQHSTAFAGGPLLDGANSYPEHPLLCDDCWSILSRDWDTVLPKHNRKLRKAFSAELNFWPNAFRNNNSHYRLTEALAKDRDRIIHSIHFDNAADPHVFDDPLILFEPDYLWDLTPWGKELLAFANGRFDSWCECLEISWKEALRLGRRTLQAAAADTSSR